VESDNVAAGFFGCCGTRLESEDNKVYSEVKRKKK
jgi:hypothetical protein